MGILSLSLQMRKLKHREAAGLKELEKDAGQATWPPGSFSCTTDPHAPPLPPPRAFALLTMSISLVRELTRSGDGGTRPGPAVRLIVGRLAGALGCVHRLPSCRQPGGRKGSAPGLWTRRWAGLGTGSLGGSRTFWYPSGCHLLWASRSLSPSPLPLRDPAGHPRAGEFWPMFPLLSPRKYPTLQPLLTWCSLSTRLPRGSLHPCWPQPRREAPETVCPAPLSTLFPLANMPRAPVS